MQVDAPAHSLSGSVPFAMFPHVPSEPLPFFAAEHARQVPVQAVLQQTPSTQFPLAQFDPRMHAVPSGLTHAPEPLQTAEPEHSLSGSVPFAMFPHVPSEPLPFFAALQARHTPLQAVLQQTPSTQLPLVQVAPVMQAVPSGFAHEPDPLHVDEPAHSLSGSVPLAMLPHVPSAPLPFFAAVHAWQRLAQVVLQHTPSTQWTLAHWPFNAQGDPFGSAAWQTPAEQFPLWQSVPTLHILPFAHAGHPGPPPPQSTSVSVPLRTPSLQVGAWQVWLAGLHTRLVQSDPKRQCLPTAHGGQVPPPQSTSVSIPS